MTAQATFALRGHNPDVLTCIANLSNDEVFTPPELATEMLDTLEDAWGSANNGASIWADSKVTFLDPVTKSGVFLREITSRLIEGLADEIPNLQERVDHIFTKQVFGIGITQLTALLARRSVYCSKFANGKHSVASIFDTEEGNIWFERTEHSWEKRKRAQRVHPTSGVTDLVDEVGTGRCRFCGAAESEYARDDALETHAYTFIHTDNIKARIAELFGADMQFDVIIGNPPYQLSDGGAGTSARPIYHHFVRQSQRLEPRYLSMVTPSRWMAGGKGLNEYREEILSDRRVRALTDYVNASDAFPGVDVSGGISFFLWDRDHAGDCLVTTISQGKVTGPVRRVLDEFDIFVRNAESVAILHKIWPNGPVSNDAMSSEVSSRMAFGFPTNARGLGENSEAKNPVELISSATTAGAKRWVDRSEVTTNAAWIDQWKSTVGGAAPAGGRPDKEGKFYGLSSIRVLPPGVVCTESYIVAGHFDSEREARNLHQYLHTKFVRFLVSLRAVTHHVTRGSFLFVPIQDFSTAWNDTKLYEKYGLNDDEITFIESMIRPMELDSE
jgi:hypothetical protein